MYIFVPILLFLAKLNFCQNKWCVFKKKRQDYNMRSCDVPQKQKGAMILSRQLRTVAAVYHSLKIFRQNTTKTECPLAI